MYLVLLNTPFSIDVLLKKFGCALRRNQFERLQAMQKNRLIIYQGLGNSIVTASDGFEGRNHILWLGVG